MTPDELIVEGRAWVIAAYPYNREHLIKTLEWLDAVEPGAPPPVRLAALTHDMERAFPGNDQPVMRYLSDAEYEQAHAARSAVIVGAWLRGLKADETLVTGVETLIRAHEVGGWHEADLVQAADSLSFLEVNIDLFAGFIRKGRFSADDVRQKIEHMYERIRIPRLKQLADPLVVAARQRLAQA